MLVFDGYFISYALRQLVADRINDNKMYILITLKDISANMLKN